MSSKKTKLGRTVILRPLMRLADCLTSNLMRLSPPGSASFSQGRQNLRKPWWHNRLVIITGRHNNGVKRWGFFFNSLDSPELAGC